jgi:hypothetical protein
MRRIMDDLKQGHFTSSDIVRDFIISLFGFGAARN